MNIRKDYAPPTVEAYIDLRLRSNMGAKEFAHAETALAHSLFTISLYRKEKLIAFGRVVGDEGITFVVTDVMVDEAYQRQGLGSLVMDEIDRYLDAHTYSDSYVTLLARTPAQELYKNYNFHITEDRIGMLRKNILQTQSK